MKELLGMHCYPETEIVFVQKKDKSKNDKKVPEFGVGYYSHNEWEIITKLFPTQFNTNQDEVFPKLRTYQGKTFLSDSSISDHEFSEDVSYPLQKVLFDQNWLFVYKGEVDKFRLVDDIFNRRFEHYLEKFVPQGESEDELICCIFLESLSKISYNLTFEKIIEQLAETAELLKPYGKLSFLLSNGEAVFAYRSASAMYYIERYPPYYDTTLAEDEDFQFKISNPQTERIIVLSSVPLTTNENWKLMEREKLYVFVDGEEMKKKSHKMWR